MSLRDRLPSRRTARLATAIPTPCSACHNAHGVSSLVGNTSNNAHLIDFDLKDEK